jgi:hypothetical protein
MKLKFKSIANENGKNEKTEIYDATKAIADEILAFDHVFLSFD